MTSVAIVDFSATGHTEQVAEAVAEGAKSVAGVVRGQVEQTRRFDDQRDAARHDLSGHRCYAGRSNSREDQSLVEL